MAYQSSKPRDRKSLTQAGECSDAERSQHAAVKRDSDVDRRKRVPQTALSHNGLKSKPLYLYDTAYRILSLLFVHVPERAKSNYYKTKHTMNIVRIISVTAEKAPTYFFPAHTSKSPENQADCPSVILWGVHIASAPFPKAEVRAK